MNTATDSRETTVRGVHGSRQYSTFRVGNLFFGIEVAEVQEVLRYQQMTHVPLAPDAFAGLINLRGQIVPAIDLRRRLGLAHQPEGWTPMNMVVRCQEGAISLLVDEIGDVVEVEDATFEDVPDNVNPDARALLRGVYKLEGRLLLILDTLRAVEGSDDFAGRSPGLEKDA